MRKKIFIISIPMLPAENLKSLQYKDSKSDFLSGETHFPGIAMLEKNISPTDSVKIITVRTEDDNNRTGECYSLFQEELSALSEKKSTETAIDEEIVVSHIEDDQKEKGLLKSLFAIFEKNADVYMDLTFGTKLTSIEMFSSLCYAEVVQSCSIRSIVYGKYSFDGGNQGELFDATGLYHTVRFMETAKQMENKHFVDLINQILE